MKHMPCQQLKADGYLKFLNHATHDKVYGAWMIYRGIDRIARRKWRTATQAIEYGKRLAERYNRMYPAPIPQPEEVQPCKE